MEEIAGCADAIAKIDDELEAEHAWMGLIRIVFLPNEDQSIRYPSP
jgi:hypothetical protein